MALSAESTSPHLRNAVYANLIKAEKTIDSLRRESKQWVEATAEDFNFDGRNEVRVGNENLVTWISPAEGGQIYELDLLGINHNLLATIQTKARVVSPKSFERQRS